MARGTLTTRDTSKCMLEAQGMGYPLMDSFGLGGRTLIPAAHGRAAMSEEDEELDEDDENEDEGWGDDEETEE